MKDLSAFINPLPSNFTPVFSAIKLTKPSCEQPDNYLSSFFFSARSWTLECPSVPEGSGSKSHQVQKQCMEVNAIRPNQMVAPVSVTLYYESLCPACRVFMSQQLFPTWTMLQDIMTVTLVPYGNTKELMPADSPFSCHHGAPECRGNIIEACIIHLTGHSAFHIIYCIESAANVVNAAEPCLKLYAPSISWPSVDSCVKGGLGYRLMHANAVMTRALNPAHTHIPWVTFNGEYTEENEDKAMSSLYHLVCQLYKGVKPPACTGAPVRLDRSFC